MDGYDNQVIKIKFSIKDCKPCPLKAHCTKAQRRTISVREPLRLAQLFTRGDQARREAQAKADSAADVIMLYGQNLGRHDAERPQFGLGLAFFLGKPSFECLGKHAAI